MAEEKIDATCPKCGFKNPMIAGRNEYKAPGKWAVEKTLDKYLGLRAYWICLECNTQFGVIYEATKIYSPSQ